MTIAILILLVLVPILLIKLVDKRAATDRVNDKLPKQTMPSATLRGVAGWNIGINVLFLGILQDELFNPESVTGDMSTGVAASILGIASLSFTFIATPFYIRYLRRTGHAAGGRKLLYAAVITNIIATVVLVLINTAIKINIA